MKKNKNTKHKNKYMYTVMYQMRIMLMPEVMHFFFFFNLTDQHAVIKNGLCGLGLKKNFSFIVLWESSWVISAFHQISQGNIC